jgi:hypothetical protein
MERFFSASNATAPVIRYASKYRRRMLLDLFLHQHDSDKYAALGTMLRNNYKQAVDIITTKTPILESLLAAMKVTRSDLDRWQGEQASYFAQVGKEPTEDIHRVAYVELLQELRNAR